MKVLQSEIILDCQDGILLRYRTDNELFNLKHLQAVWKIKETLIKGFLFLDDWAFVTQIEQKVPQESEGAKPSSSWPPKLPVQHPLLYSQYRSQD